MNPRKILIVDDESAIRRLLKSAVERAGYEVVESANAKEALTALQIDKPVLALLDLGLPDRDGMELIQLLKQHGCAVIVISAREATAEKVAALDLGAEDYVTKPFDTAEVLARIRTALRRGEAVGPAVPLIVGSVVIDLERRVVTKGGAEVHLRPKEYALLAELAKQAGKVLTHSHLLTAVWGAAHSNDLEYLRVAARGLRMKLEDNPALPVLIRNEPAVGYRLQLE